MKTQDLAYFWRNGEVLTLNRAPYSQLVKELNYFDLYCVDMTRSTEDMRYGRFVTNKDWVSIPYSDFPKEFLVTLLITT